MAPRYCHVAGLRKYSPAGSTDRMGPATSATPRVNTISAGQMRKARFTA